MWCISYAAYGMSHTVRANICVAKRFLRNNIFQSFITVLPRVALLANAVIITVSCSGNMSRIYMYRCTFRIQIYEIIASGTCPNMIDANGIVSTNIKGTLVNIGITIVPLKSTETVTLATFLIFRNIQVIMTFSTLT